MIEIQFYSGKPQVLLACKDHLDGRKVSELHIARLQRRFGMTKVQARIYADLYFRGMCDV